MPTFTIVGSGTGLAGNYGDGDYGDGLYGGSGEEATVLYASAEHGPNRPPLVLSGTGPFTLEGADAELAREAWVRAGILDEA